MDFSLSQKLDDLTLCGRALVCDGCILNVDGRFVPEIIAAATVGETVFTPGQLPRVSELHSEMEIAQWIANASLERPEGFYDRASANYYKCHYGDVNGQRAALSFIEDCAGLAQIELIAVPVGETVFSVVHLHRLLLCSRPGYQAEDHAVSDLVQHTLSAFNAGNVMVLGV